MSFVLLMSLVGAAFSDKALTPSPSPNSKIELQKMPVYKTCPDEEVIIISTPCAQKKVEPIAVFDTPVATPRNLKSTWVTYNDYPTHALNRELEGVSRINLTVDKNGLISRCSIFQTSGFRELDEAACKSVRRRAQFHPAKDGKGNPINGSYSTNIRWSIPDRNRHNISKPFVFPEPTFGSIVPPTIFRYDMLSIGLGDYPSEALIDGEQGTITVRVTVGANGKVGYCRIISSDTKSASPLGPLEKRSCDIVRQRWFFLPAEDGNGQKQASEPNFKFVWAIPPTVE